MQNALIIYAIIQLITTAYGLAVIESIRPMVEEKLRDQGYIKNKNSLYTFSNTLMDIAKGFIPCYYLVKAIRIISDKSSVDKRVNEQIKKKNYINENDIENEIEEEDTTDSIYKGKYDLAFEKPEKYTARKNDISIYDTYETPIDYIERVSNQQEDDLSITPFESDTKVIEHVVVKDEVTNADIAHKISQLTPAQLDRLGGSIVRLAEYKRQKALKLKQKEVA